MAAAPTLEALFDTQAIVESAFAAYLTTNGLSGYVSRGLEDMPDARIIVTYEPGASTGHQATQTTSKTGWPELDWFSGRLTLEVQTERAKDTVSPDPAIPKRHDYWVARLKTLILRGAINGTLTGITELSVPYHRIVIQGFAGQVVAASNDASEPMDVTALGYDLQLQILADAWPENPAP